MMSRVDHRGFSLLEVMVAVSIFGLALTVILAAQGGLSASNSTAARLGTATTLGRCKMTEVEEKLLKNGYPLIDQIDTDQYCCEEKETPGFRCDTRVEKIELPQGNQGSGMDAGLDLGGMGSLGGLLGGGDGGITGTQLQLDGGIQGLTSQLGQQASAGNVQGLLTMVMGMVYPSLKPTFEASIRRITVRVKWKEGPNERELNLVQYVTRPQPPPAIPGLGDGGLPNLLGGGAPGLGAPGTGAAGGAADGTGASPATGTQRGAR